MFSITFGRIFWGKRPTLPRQKIITQQIQLVRAEQAESCYRMELLTRLMALLESYIRQELNQRETLVAPVITSAISTAMAANMLARGGAPREGLISGGVKDSFTLFQTPMSW